MNSNSNSNPQRPRQFESPAVTVAHSPLMVPDAATASASRQPDGNDHASPRTTAAIPLTRTRTSRSAATARSVARSTRSTARSTRSTASRVPAVTLLTNSRARSARFTMANHITQAWANASKHSRLVLILSILFQLAQTALPVAGLAITGRSGYSDGCAQLVTLNTAIAMRSFFLAVLLPYLFVLQRTSRARGISMSQSPEARIAFEAREVLNWVTAVLFILANFWVFMTPQCPAGTSLVTVTVIWILVTYLVYLTPLLLAVALILCLPCLLVAANHPRLNRVLSTWLHPQMQHRRAGGAVGAAGTAEAAGLSPWNGQLGALLTRPRGITTQELDKIECFTFSGRLGEESDDEEDQIDHGATREPSPNRTSDEEHDLALQPMTRHENIHLSPNQDHAPVTISTDPDGPSLPSPTYPPLALAADDAQCIICFEDYVPGDKLHVYKCGHHFHASCSSNWLSLSTLCPLCKQCVVTGQPTEVDHGAGAGGTTEMVELAAPGNNASASTLTDRVPRVASVGASAA